MHTLGYRQWENKTCEDLVGVVILAYGQCSCLIRQVCYAAKIRNLSAAHSHIKKCLIGTLHTILKSYKKIHLIYLISFFHRHMHPNHKYTHLVNWSLNFHSLIIRILFMLMPKVLNIFCSAIFYEVWMVTFKIRYVWFLFL